MQVYVYLHNISPHSHLGTALTGADPALTTHREHPTFFVLGIVLTLPSRLGAASREGKKRAPPTTGMTFSDVAVVVLAPEGYHFRARTQQ